MFEEKQYMSFPLSEDFTFPKADSVLLIKISNPEIQIYSSSIKIVANLFGLSYYIYWYFYTSLLIGTAIIFTFYTTVFIISTVVALYYYWPVIFPERISNDDEIPIEDVFKD